MKEKTDIKSYKSIHEKDLDRQAFDLFQDCPIPKDQLMENLGLFLNAKNFSRILFMEHIYKKIIDVQGIIMDFGTRWGNNLALFSLFRGIYEPFNRHRKLVGFDTFKGFPNIDKKDGDSSLMKKGNVSCTKNYKDYLEKIMKIQEMQNPVAHIKKYELCSGDAIKTLPKYLNNNPETIIALAYFDFDLYEPTVKCLNLIKSRLTKGSVLGFDELNDNDSPGETLALKEVFGLNQIRLKRLPITSRTSYFILE